MEVLFALFLFLCLIALYLLPCFVAFGRSHKNRAAITVMNIFLGWSFFGWIVALIWAFTSNTEPSTP